ncbi:MAG: hypothetical protein EBS95_10375, partial [Chitinophagia bacterium]|nr:hypothetical protein [Chitinophagia bacterium]
QGPVADRPGKPAQSIALARQRRSGTRVRGQCSSKQRKPQEGHVRCTRCRKAHRDVKCLGCRSQVLHTEAIGQEGCGRIDRRVLAHKIPADRPVRTREAADQATDVTVTAAGGLTALPAGTVTYASASPSVTIAKGTRVSPAFTCQINTGSLDPTKAYGLAFTISSVSKTGVSIPKNLKTVVYKIALKNKYDGVYKVTGPMTDVGSATLTQYLPSWTANLETTGPTSVAVRDMTATGGIFHPIMNGGAPSYYGAFGMVVTFDPATNVATNMVSPYEPAANGRTARLDPTFTSKWDPATKNIRIKYHMFQPGFGGGGPRVVFDETWTYQGPRK